MDPVAGGECGLRKRARNRLSPWVFELKEVNKMKWFYDSMLGYWVLLLVLSLGASAFLYLTYLKELMR
jgi:hypothetical protein